MVQKKNTRKMKKDKQETRKKVAKRRLKKRNMILCEKAIINSSYRYDQSSFSSYINLHYYQNTY